MAAKLWEQSQTRLLCTAAKTYWRSRFKHWQATRGTSWLWLIFNSARLAHKGSRETSNAAEELCKSSWSCGGYKPTEKLPSGTWFQMLVIIDSKRTKEILLIYVDVYLPYTCCFFSQRSLRCPTCTQVIDWIRQSTSLLQKSFPCTCFTAEIWLTLLESPEGSCQKRRNLGNQLQSSLDDTGLWHKQWDETLNRIFYP